MIRARDKAIAAAGLSVIIFSGVLASYNDAWDRFFEMTFLSNTLASVILFVGAVKLFATGRDIPQVLYLDVSVLLLFVIGICAAYAPEVCLGGAAIILHLVNPLLMFAFFSIFCDARTIKFGYVFTSLIFPSLYYVFMIAYGRITGGYVYPYFDPNLYGAGELIMYAALAAVIMSALSVGVAAGNSAVRSRFERAHGGRRVAG